MTDFSRLNEKLSNSKIIVNSVTACKEGAFFTTLNFLVHFLQLEQIEKQRES